MNIYTSETEYLKTEVQRMAKRIEELEVMLERQTARIVDLGVVIETVEQLGEECFDE